MEVQIIRRPRRPITRRLAAIALIITTGLVAAWIATGRQVFTKYESFDERSDAPRPDDPFAAAGFYEGAPTSRVVRVESFQLGLLPAPTSVLDKHVISVTTITGPLWALVVGITWVRRARYRHRVSRSISRQSSTCHHCQ